MEVVCLKMTKHAEFQCGLTSFPKSRFHTVCIINGKCFPEYPQTLRVYVFVRALIGRERIYIVPSLLEHTVNQQPIVVVLGPKINNNPSVERKLYKTPKTLLLSP